MNSFDERSPTIFVLFGATGDLSRRYIIPSLFHLWGKLLLPQAFQLIGFSRRKLTNKAFQAYVGEILTAGRMGDAKKRTEFAKLCTYHSGLFDKPAGYETLARSLGRSDHHWMACSNKLFYFAVPPIHYKDILAGITRSGLTAPCAPGEGWTRVLIEKPFGSDAKTAEELDARLGKILAEEQIYRIDHYLGKDTVQNILAFRFSNAFFEPLWNSRHIESVHLQFFETLGMEGRGESYDGVGALRDVGQNHLCQLLAHFLMENPGEFTADTIRRGREDVLARLVVPGQGEIHHTFQRGQYVGYRSEPGVAKNSDTETYFRVVAQLSGSRFSGVPIIIEGGKKMAESKVQVVITFKHPSPCLCPKNSRHEYRNTLRYEIKPHEKISTSFWIKKPGHEILLEEKEFVLEYRKEDVAKKSISPYEKLLLDALRGNQTLFVSTKETMASWRFIDPILSAWRSNRSPLLLYPPHFHPVLLGDIALSASSKKPSIGIIGLGKMGYNLAGRLARSGWDVVAHDPGFSSELPDAMRSASSLDDLIEKLPTPRTLWLMVPSGAVDKVLFGVDGLESRLSKGDIIIDGGNSFFEATRERAKKLSRRKITFIDAGVSGGPSGAKNGACLMVGGDKKVVEKLSSLFEALAVPGGYAHVGPSGAGHFVKMIHNGIEYGMMQSLAEGFAILKKSPYRLDLKKIATLYNNGSVIESRLVGWLADGFEKYGTGLQGVSGAVGRLGEGEWTVNTAKKLGIAVPVIAASLEFRVASFSHPSFTGKILSVLRGQFGGHPVVKGKIKVES